MGATDLAEQLAKILPVGQIYSDLLSPAMKQVGYTLKDVIKCLRLATFPIQVGSASQTQLQDFLKSAVQRVSQDKRVLPAPQILGPVIEGARYEPSGTEIEAMFLELLSRSMDSDHLGDAHPSFPLLIRQLSTDEARIIKIIAEGSAGSTKLQRVITHRHASGRSYVENEERDDFPKADLIYPDRLLFYMNHLWTLGIAGIFEIRQDPTFKDGKQYGDRQFLEYRLTELGSLFAQATLPRPDNS
jgi:hypothetical protein